MEKQRTFILIAFFIDGHFSEHNYVDYIRFNVVHSVYGKFDGHSHSHLHLRLRLHTILFFFSTYGKLINRLTFHFRFCYVFLSFSVAVCILQQSQREKFFHIFMCKRLHLNMNTRHEEKEKTELYSRKNRMKCGKWPIIKHRIYTIEITLHTIKIKRVRENERKKERKK